MPRPGCVWTHVLLLPPIFFEGVPNLNVLKEFVRRPTTREDRSTYNEPIAIQIRTNAVVKFSSAPGFRKIVEEILAALYGKGPVDVPVAEPNIIEDAVFAVWSQQWPRLRRNFRFQTAINQTLNHISRLRLDVAFKIDKETVISSVSSATNTGWQRAACADIFNASSATLRPFLWKYGGDVRKQRGSFKPLCKIKMLNDDPGINAGR